MPPIRNDERLLVEAVVRFAGDRGLKLVRMSQDWVMALEGPAGRHLVFGYDLGLNGATTLRVCNDKAATYDVLAAAAVPMIEHRLFLEPIMHRFTGLPGNWSRLLEAFEAFARDVVVKANEGTSGNDVHRVTSTAELERVVHLLLQSCRSVAVSPFTELTAEKRFVVLDGEILLAYAKERLSVEGDGKTAIRQLAAAAMDPAGAEEFADWLAGVPRSELDRVPTAGERVVLGWRHNLGHGAQAERIDPEAPAHAAAAGLALRAAEAVALRFGSVDIAETMDGAPVVMEVNAGVMLEHFGRRDPEARATALGIYTAALARAFPG
ncbi:MAG: ATP-grasp domain-containing protein [Minwuia sp.]|uniref:ATP-grasp domain-containing protein n=1 Tax=Minwuia sp. TaxID=2493630 RepID=UPI003A86A0C4